MKSILKEKNFVLMIIAFVIYMGSCSSQDNSDTDKTASDKELPKEEIKPDKNDVSFLPKPTNGKTWTIQPKVSNEFNYEEGKASNKFYNHWNDRFFNEWTGPGITRYTPSQSSVVGGELAFKANIVDNTILTGCVTSKSKVSYPLYMEVRVKLSASVLSSAVWMLSEDSTEEIDNLEAFGDKSNDYFSKRLHLSHHVFIRDPFKDYQPTGPETWYADGKGTIWSDDYHNYGVLWEDPWHLSYYVDGILVRETLVNEIDPENYTNGAGLTKPMHLIISAAAQSWRENQGVDFLNDPTVTNEEKTVMRVDWIRVYKPE
ncbi:family 16 glycosylhydrolase [Cellulophaga omnivescoria]|uniref:family 16 glycosylhydrolase n=1 Tax=Cellulophaga omnivescoria TaxID=1888890 RepID=UPI0022F09316|nr:family 16 glycosylhydrolase [Cellulophaga omnivescoria]WBU89820.1 family 16 glycosylhydrolase [Cellulophaga omnivescoria]